MISHVNPRTVKDSLIFILSTKWPLTAKALYVEYARIYNRKVTYQSIHKALSGLEQENVLKKSSGKYMLNIQWIDNLYSFSKKLKHSYSGGHLISSDELIRMQSPIVLKFTNIIELDDFFLDFADELSKIAGNKSIIMHYRHNWWPLFNSMKELKLAEKGAKKYFFLCASDTVVDRWCSEFEKIMGFNIQHDSGCAALCDVQVFGDIVFQIFIPKKTMQTIDNIYRNTKSIDTLNKQQLIEKAFKCNDAITVIIDRNPGMAEGIRNYTLARFR